LPFLLGCPLPQALLAPFAAPDDLQSLIVPLEVDAAFDKDLFNLAEQTHNVVRELRVEAVLGHEVRPFSFRLLDRELVKLDVGVPLELRPGPAVQVGTAVLADKGAGLCDVCTQVASVKRLSMMFGLLSIASWKNFTMPKIVRSYRRPLPTKASSSQT